MFRARRTRQVPRRAPRILLSSKEFIADRLQKRHRGLGKRNATVDVRRRSERYRFACPVATRISAAAKPAFTSFQPGETDVGHAHPDPRAHGVSPPAW